MVKTPKSPSQHLQSIYTQPVASVVTRKEARISVGLLEVFMPQEGPIGSRAPHHSSSGDN